MARNPISVVVQWLVLFCLACSVGAYHYHDLPPLRTQAELQDAWTAGRKAQVPALMRKYGVDAWLTTMKEYAEDTVFWSLKPATAFSARRRTTCLFLAANPDASFCFIGWMADVWEHVKAVLQMEQPSSIAINAHPEIAFASGLHAGELEALSTGLGPPWVDKLVVQPMLAVEYIATQPRARLPHYKRMMETAWAMIDDAFSSRVIAPGRTTTEDVEWWLREQLQAKNFTTWFHPDVSVLEDALPFAATGEGGQGGKVIQYGDLLHVDFGITAMGMNTDTQHLAYVLYPGQTEEDVPQGLLDGLHKGNKLQDIVKTNLKIGRSGNDMLHASQAQMYDAGIKGRIYSHPIGDWGHSAGPLIGLWNMQDYVSASGELPALANMWFSVELSIEHFVPERNTTINFPLEEDVYWVDQETGWDWVFGRQERFHLIRTPVEEGARVTGEL